MYAHLRVIAYVMLLMVSFTTLFSNILKKYQFLISNCPKNFNENVPTNLWVQTKFQLNNFALNRAASARKFSENVKMVQKLSRIFPTIYEKFLSNSCFDKRN